MQGAAWTAPAILVATAAPARAASLPTGGITFLSFTSYSNGFFWIAPTGPSVPAVVVQSNLQNQGDATTPTIRELLLTIHAYVGNPVSLQWGLGSNATGVASSAPGWDLVTGPTLDSGTGIVTLEFVYALPIPPSGTVQPWVWIRSEAVETGQHVSAIANATHDDGYTSVATHDATITFGEPASEPGAFVYHPQEPSGPETP